MYMYHIRLIYPCLSLRASSGGPPLQDGVDQNMDCCCCLLVEWSDASWAHSYNVLNKPFSQVYDGYNHG